jgi:multidrug efflux pump
MAFTDLFIRKPVLATVVNLFILLLGVMAYQQLTVRQYPRSENAIITVNTVYAGAAAELVQGFVTIPLEREIASAEGIDFLESNSSQGSSSIVAHLKLNYDANVALTQITAKVNKIRNQLPGGSEDPTITISSDESTASMYLAFRSDTIEPNQITDYLAREVQPRLESISGVEQAQVRGARNFAMRIWLDPQRMAALGVTPAQLRQALTANNFQAAVGRTKGATVSVNLRADTDLHTVADFRQLIVRQQDNTVIRLHDIAEVVLGAEDYDTSVRVWGEPVIILAVSVLPNANVLDVIDLVRRQFADIQAQLPPGMSASIMYDKTRYIEEAIAEVRLTLVEALAIVTLVIYLFLGSLRALLIPVVTIPLSLIGAGLIMLLLGYSINLLTLLALVIAIGLVVDDAIIMAENIHRHVEEGVPVLPAAFRGARELATPVIAMTITLVAVYLPIGFIGGLTGSLFSEFAFTLAGAVLISGIIALTLSPMMCSRLFKPHAEQAQGLEQALDRAFESLRGLYQRWLHRALQRVPAVLVVSALVLASIYFMFAAARRELAPTEDEGLVIVQSAAPANTSPDQLLDYAGALTAAFRTAPEVDRVLQFNGGNSAMGGGGSTSVAVVVFKPRSERDKSQDELQAQLQRSVDGIAGFKSAVFTRPPMPGAGRGAAVQFVIGATEPAIAVYEVVQQFMDRVRDSGKFTFVDADLKFDLPQIMVHVDRDKAADLGIDMQQFGTDLAVMLGGNYVNRFSISGQSYKVIPQVARRYRLNPEQLGQFQVATRSGALVPASAFVSFERRVTPQSLKRFQQLNSATLSAVPVRGLSVGDALNYLAGLARDTLPRGYSVDYAGASRQYVNEGSSLIGAFFVAMLIIYLVLAAQFESFRDPLIMLVSVPMSVAGALLFLWQGFATINIYTQIGLITLIGLVSKHGILIVQFANQIQREQGLGRRQAVERAAGIRLRPILMTTAAMVLGVVPLLLASGAGAMARFDIGLVIATGMSIGTLFTLFVVPAMYSLLAQAHHHGAQRAAQPLEQAQAAPAQRG